MLRNLLFVCWLIIVPAAAQAPSEVDADLSSASEIKYAELPGPGDGETRTVYFWRPPGAPTGPLPVLYMTDGIRGLRVALTQLRPAILSGRVSPIVVVAMDANPTHRLEEYVRWRRTNPYWEAHFAWFINTVVPWSEIHAGASRERSHRGVGGASNGADFAIAAASLRPDMFSMVLAHSPVNDLHSWFRSSPGTRWVLTAGTYEDGVGEIAHLNSRIAVRIGRRPMRRCIGPWQHDLQSWRDLSAGSIAWLYGLAAPESVALPIETRNCENHFDDQSELVNASAQ